MLMTTAIANSYPTIEGNTSNFITDYLANSEKFDKVFMTKFMSKKAIFIDTAAFPTSYNEWIEECNAFILYYLDSWARLYYALSLAYNPTWNYDGKNTSRTAGTTEGLSGSDTNNVQLGSVNNTDVLAADITTNTDYSIPYDMTTEKETGKSQLSNSERTATHIENARTNISNTTYGRENNVDFTVTEIKGGNQGTTSTQQLLNEEYEIRKKAFWDNVFDTLSKELTMW